MKRVGGVVWRCDARWANGKGPNLGSPLGSLLVEQRAFLEDGRGHLAVHLRRGERFGNERTASRERDDAES